MTAYNVVRFRVNRGREKEFMALHARMEEPMKGHRRGTRYRAAI
jgi:hypothetical protein